MTTTPWASSVSSVAEEFRQVDLGDERRNARLRAIAATWSATPNASITRTSKSSAMVEATYRLLNNAAVTYDSIAEAHIQETCLRVVEAGEVIVPHDTSEFAYSGEVRREGLGRLRKKADQGFLAHVALAISASEERDPLGILGFSPWVRTAPPRRKKKNGTKRSGADYAKDVDKESSRWFEMVEEISGRFNGSASLIHVMDREADDYLLLNRLLEGTYRFVVRLSKNRTVLEAEEEGGFTTTLLKTALARVEGICELEVPVTRRAKTTVPATARTFPARDARVAKLQFCSTTLEVKKPKYLNDVPTSLPLNTVYVREVDVPEGVEPIEWILATSEPITTAPEVLRVVRLYRARWTIEEFFKALKTGCAVEKRQHESVHALVNATAICLPIAWRMLRLRTLARRKSEASASVVLTATQLAVLKACSPIELSKTPNVRDALLAVAAMGGHLKNNGEPGWLTLGRGMEQLLLLEAGWIARDSLKKSDR